jgi:hypothetical protein
MIIAGPNKKHLGMDELEEEQEEGTNIKRMASSSTKTEATTQKMGTKRTVLLLTSLVLALLIGSVVLYQDSSSPCNWSLPSGAKKDVAHDTSSTEEEANNELVLTDQGGVESANLRGLGVAFGGDCIDHACNSGLVCNRYYDFENEWYPINKCRTHFNMIHISSGEGQYWRIAEMDSQHLAIGHSENSYYDTGPRTADKISMGKVAMVFRSDGTRHESCCGNDWDIKFNPTISYPTESSTGPIWGNKMVQIGQWRIADIGAGHLVIGHSSGKVSQIFRWDGTIHPAYQGNVDANGYSDFSPWKRPLGNPTCAFQGKYFLQIGEWRFRPMDTVHMSVGQKTGYTSQIYLNDGTTVPNYGGFNWSPWRVAEDGYVMFDGTSVNKGNRGGC